MKKKKPRVLFVASLADESNHFDGERNKSSLILKYLTSIANVTAINYTKNKYLQSLKMIILLTFRRYDKIIISKAITGASVAFDILKFMHVKKQTIYYFMMGFGFVGFDDKRINPKGKKFKMQNFHYCNKIICEAQIVKDQLAKDGFTNVAIFPCLKEQYPVQTEKQFEIQKTLKLIFFSRAVDSKGIFDLIKSIKIVNSDFPKYDLVIAGASIKNDEKLLLGLIEGRKDIHYLGTSFSVTGQETYQELAKYDLHVFPTKNRQEGIPGSIIDFFIAGVPTLSSSYPAVREILDDDCAYFFEYENVDSLTKSLIHIYENQEELFSKRKYALKRAERYTPSRFVEFVSKEIFA